MQITLKAARANAGLTQEEAAEKIGVSKDAIRSWEQQKSFPNSKYIPAIEAVYGVEYKDLKILPQ